MDVFYGVCAGFAAGVVFNYVMYQKEIKAGKALAAYVKFKVGSAEDKTVAVIKHIIAATKEAVEKL